LQSAVVQLTNTLSDRGVVVDSQLNMTAHVTALSRRFCMYQLRQPRAVRHSLFTDAAWTLASAFTSSRLDYCNGLFVGVTSRQMDNAAVPPKCSSVIHLEVRKVRPRFATCTGCPSVRVLISRCMATLVDKCLHGLAPPTTEYTSILVVSSLSGRQHLRSADTLKSFVPKTFTNYGS